MEINIGHEKYGGNKYACITDKRTGFEMRI